VICGAILATPRTMCDGGMVCSETEERKKTIRKKWLTKNVKILNKLNTFIFI
jgi:hypothetical protein